MAANIATIRVELIANAQKFKSSLEGAKTKLKTVDKSALKTTGRMKGMSKAFQNTAGSIAAVQGPLGPVAGRLSAIGAIIGRVSPLMLVGTAAVVGLGLAFTKLIKNTTQTQTQLLKLEAILKATGNAAGLNLAEVENLSREIGVATLASTAKVRDAAGIMLTFKSITGETFKDALRLAQDLAEVGFGDLKMGATQLGKALEDPIVGLGALRRVGVSFTDAQKEMIKVLTMTGRKAEAQRIILDALDQQVGGAGVKAAKGLSGAIDSLGENLDIFFEKTKFGIASVNVLTDGINFLANAFSNADMEASKLTAVSEVTAEMNKLKQELIDIENIGFFKKLSLNALGIDVVGARIKDIKNNISDLKIQMSNLSSDANKDFIRDEVKAKRLEEEKLKKVTTDLGKIRETNEKNHTRSHQRSLEDMGKTEKELKTINDLRKIEDELRKKIGSDGIMAEIAIREEMEKTRQGIIERNIEFEKFNQIQKDLDAIAKGTGNTFASVGDKISDAMFRGKLHTLDFKNILLEMVIALQKMIFKVMVLDKIQKQIEERMGKGNIFKDILGVFTGGDAGTNVGAHAGAAGGGTVQQGSPTLVGERGPELFVPNSAGAIRTNADTKKTMSGGGGVNVTQNLNFAVGITNTVRAEVMNMLPAIQQSTVQAVADAKQRGGKFSKAFGS